MKDSIILTNAGPLILAVVAVFALIVSWFIKNKNVGAFLSVISFLLVLACITYSLLLKASLTEILILILVFVFFGLFSFLPLSTEKTTKSDETIENKQIESEEEHKKEYSE